MAGRTLAQPQPYEAARSILTTNQARVVEIILVIALLGLGLALRLIRLTDPPLDFQPTRQLRAAIIARGMYYEDLPGADPQKRTAAINIWATMERYEPPVLEQIVAWTYRLIGGEALWVARVYSSLFWLIGGMALYGLVRRALSPGAALFALGFYLILPWGVVASRAFQPDPWMVMLILCSAYTLYRWSETEACSWFWAVLSGLFAGLAMLIKINALYAEFLMAAGMLLSLVWGGGSPVKTMLGLIKRPQIWVFAVLCVVIPGVYYLRADSGSAGFTQFWIVSFAGLLLQSKFYIHWLGLIHGIVDVGVFFAGLLGAFLYPRRARVLVYGLWVGYFLIGVTFPYQIYTHDYYSLILVPILAISLAPIIEAVLVYLTRRPVLVRMGFMLVFLGITGYYAYVARSQVYAYNNKSEPIPWQLMGEKLPNNGAIIALTHDYGNRLKYYGWRSIQLLWPSQGDVDLAAAGGHDKFGDDFAGYFKSQTAGMDYFLVTLFGDFNAQPALKSMLYDHYPIAQQGDGYVLFDLRHPK